MADTASNANRTIATMGSNHVAVMTGPDVCKLPSGVPVPFPNFVPTTRAGAGKTSNTYIGSQAIVVDRTKVGPQSDPAHAGVLGGVKSGTYRFEAQATSFSRDVFAEGGALVRSFDSTTQNQGNTTGIVLSMLDSAALAAQEREKRKKCVIDVFHGECVHGRQLGWPGPKKDGEPRYLEVLQNDTVHFRTVRLDTTKTPHEPYPKCIAGNHTAWRAEAVKFPNPNQTVASKPEGKGTIQAEVFQVPASLALEDWILQLIEYDRKDTDEPDEKAHFEKEEPTRKGMQQEALDGLRRSNPRASRKQLDDAVTAANKKFDDYQRETGEKGRANPKFKADKTALAKSLTVSLREGLLLWLWYVGAPQITVTATACGGSRSATIRVFPSRDFQLAIELLSLKRRKAIPTKETMAKRDAALAASDQKRRDTIAQRVESLKMSGLDEAETVFQVIYNTLNAMRILMGVAEKFAQYAGPVMGSKLSCEFLVGLRVQWNFQYVECNQLKGQFECDMKTPAHVGRRWSLFVGAKPLIGINGYITFPILSLIPGVGLIASRIIRLDGYFEGRTMITLGAVVGRDEYDYCKEVGGKIDGDIDLAAGLAIGIGRWKAVKAQLRLDTDFGGQICLFTGDPHTLIGAKVGASIKGGFELIVFPDSWLFRRRFPKDGPYRPGWAQIDFGPKDMTLLPSIR
jgi:hypothetical protein